MSFRTPRAAAPAAPAALVAVLVGGLAAQQPPPIGVAPVTIGAGPYLFDTAEQHQLRVVVVARGLSHPYGLALLPDGDALVTDEDDGVLLRLEPAAAASR